MLFCGFIILITFHNLILTLNIWYKKKDDTKLSLWTGFENKFSKKAPWFEYLKTIEKSLKYMLEALSQPILFSYNWKLK